MLSGKKLVRFKNKLLRGYSGVFCALLTRAPDNDESVLYMCEKAYSYLDFEICYTVRLWKENYGHLKPCFSTVLDVIKLVFSLGALITKPYTLFDLCKYMMAATSQNLPLLLYQICT